MNEQVNLINELLRFIIRRSILTFAIILMVPVLARAGWTQNWESIHRVMAKVHSISADFVQKKNLKILARPLVSRGRFYYRTPDELRWEYLSPIKDVLLIHKDKVARYTWTEKGFTREEGPQIEATHIVMEQISSWLNGNFHDNKAFIPRLKQGSPAEIELVPANSSLTHFIRRIILTLSGTEGVISSIEILEPQGSSTVIEFSHISLNTAIPDAKFEKVK